MERELKKNPLTVATVQTSQAEDGQFKNSMTAIESPVIFILGVSLDGLVSLRNLVHVALSLFMLLLVFFA